MGHLCETTGSSTGGSLKSTGTCLKSFPKWACSEPLGRLKVYINGSKKRTTRRFQHQAQGIMAPLNGSAQLVVVVVVVAARSPIPRPSRMTSTRRRRSQRCGQHRAGSDPGAVKRLVASINETILPRFARSRRLEDHLSHALQSVRRLSGTQKVCAKSVSLSPCRHLSRRPFPATKPCEPWSHMLQVTEKNIDTARESYRPVAFRTAVSWRDARGGLMTTCGLRRAVEMRRATYVISSQGQMFLRRDVASKNWRSMN